MINVRRNRTKDTPYSNLRPLTRVELHVHLDGSIRHETIWELCKEKNIPLPGKGTFEELKDYLVVKVPKDLGEFLKRFDVILNCIKGDLTAIERVAYEFVEDCSRAGIVYCEARFCPHIIIPNELAHPDEGTTVDESKVKKWVWDVTGALIKGLKKGQAEFTTHANLIATCIRGYPPAWYNETIELLADTNFHEGRLVGIDIAALPATACESHMLGEDAVNVFKKATELGIHRTVHAGESGPAIQVVNALEILNAERIGHGYAIAKDANVYQRIKNDRVHLECCPWSSLLTGAVSPFDLPHPIVRFFEDDFNVSINTDDPTVTGTKIDDEFRLLSNWGLCESHFVRAAFNAARSCFLQPSEKADLLQNLGKTLGFVPPS